jgi:peptidoglycan/LPS O-acetylase OafA/YrhL
VEPAAIKYRSDIDGLRALAILPVVWFHSDLPGVPGGFTGVDTFFVISGYLITLIIHREVSSGTFSFAHFYERRFRRIAPALLLVTAAVTAAGYALLLPYELLEYSRSAVAALGIVSNVFFWRAGGYFKLAEAITPLLHTWSLGVEEQFYLLFPTLLIAAERLRGVKRTVALLAVLSLALSLILTPRSPAAAFYLLPTRGWELMAGAGLAVGLIAIPPRLGGYAGLCGIALLFIAAFAISGDDPFPGWRALIPALGAALVIGSPPQALAGRLLSWPPLVYLGRISYSLYLWHWPVFVFLRHWRAAPLLPPTLALIGIGSAVALAAATYKTVEQPARDRSVPFTKVLIACGSAAAIVLLALALALLGGGLPQRFSPQVARIASGHDAYAPLAHACTDIGFDAAFERCHIGPAGKPRLLLFGDSHAAAISEAVGLAFQQPGVILSMGTCAPALDWTNPGLRGRDPQTCRHFKARALSFAQNDSGIETVVLSAYWASHARAGGAEFWRSVQQFADSLTSRGKRVIVIAGIPDPGVDVPWGSAIRARFHRPPLRLDCAPARVPLSRVTIVDVSSGFCRYPASALFTDDNHVSRFAGQAIIAPALQRALAL